MNNPKILVTGATGFLGKNLVQKLLSEFHPVDIIATGGHEDASHSVHKLDVTDFEAILAFIGKAKPDVVYHVGGLVDLTRSYDVGRRCIDVNLLGTTNLLEALSHSPPKRFIMASTEEVYGGGSIPYREESPTNPPSPYAITKLAAEHMCRIYGLQFGFPVSIFRIGTMYGPHLPAHRYIHQTIVKALAGDDIPLNSGLKKRDYIYVGDVVDAMIMALYPKPYQGTDIINLGSGVNMTLKSLVEKIVALTQSKSKLRIGQIPDRIAEADEWLLDIAKARKVLGWTPKTDIETGLKKTIEFYKLQK